MNAAMIRTTTNTGNCSKTHDGLPLICEAISSVFKNILLLCIRKYVENFFIEYSSEQLTVLINADYEYSSQKEYRI